MFKSAAVDGFDFADMEIGKMEERRRSEGS